MKKNLNPEAKNLLSTSPFFEPFIPDTQQNALEALILLGQLKEITQENLSKLRATQLEAKRQAKEFAEKSSEKSKDTKASKESKQAGSMQPLSVQSQAAPRNKKHEALIQALEAIRNLNHPYQKRYQSGNSVSSSPIIRAKKP